MKIFFIKLKLTLALWRGWKHHHTFKAQSRALEKEYAIYFACIQSRMHVK